MQTIAQARLNYTQNPFDLIVTYKLLELAAENIGGRSAHDLSAAQALLKWRDGLRHPQTMCVGRIPRRPGLLVKELADGGWTLPGGWIDLTNRLPGLPNARWEETGYEVRR